MCQAHFCVCMFLFTGLLPMSLVVRGFFSGQLSLSRLYFLLDTTLGLMQLINLFNNNEIIVNDSYYWLLLLYSTLGAGILLDLCTHQCSEETQTPVRKALLPLHDTVYLLSNSFCSPSPVLAGAVRYQRGHRADHLTAPRVRSSDRAK